MNLMRFRNRLKQHALWIWHGKYHLLSIAATIITAFYLSGFLTFYPNIVAVFLSLAGLLIILTQQILDAKQFYAHQPNTFANWIKSFPVGKPISLSVDSAVHAIAGRKVHLTVSIADDATIEKKVDFLLRQVAELDSALAKIDDNLDEVHRRPKKSSRPLSIH